MIGSILVQPSNTTTLLLHHAPSKSNETFSYLSLKTPPHIVNNKIDNVCTYVHRIMMPKAKDQKNEMMMC